jgi:hypothetical protein
MEELYKVGVMHYLKGNSAKSVRKHFEGHIQRLGP